MKWIRRHTNFFLLVSASFLTGGLFYLWQTLGIAALGIPIVMTILIQLKIYLNQVRNRYYHIVAQQKLLKAQDLYLQQAQSFLPDIEVFFHDLREYLHDIHGSLHQFRNHFNQIKEQCDQNLKQMTELHEIEVKEIKDLDCRIDKQHASLHQIQLSEARKISEQLHQHTIEIKAFKSKESDKIEQQITKISEAEAQAMMRLNHHIGNEFGALKQSQIAGFNDFEKRFIQMEQCFTSIQKNEFRVLKQSQITVFNDFTKKFTEMEQCFTSIQKSVKNVGNNQSHEIKDLRYRIFINGNKRANDYQQIEALFNLNQMIKPRLSLPPTRGWAVSPDFINIMMMKIKERKPKIIVELGSGVSTLIAGYILEAYGFPGKILSLDHLKKYADITHKNIKNHELEKVATVIHAPLEKGTFNGKQHLWYQTDAFKDIKYIDMLIIDGPPEATQKLARYPALPALYDRLEKNAVILLDDTIREDEQEILKLWKKEYENLIIEHFETEKGTAVMSMSSSH